jgi:hypothetical protein
MSRLFITLSLALSILVPGAALASPPPARYDYKPKMPVKVIRVDAVPVLCKNAMQKIACTWPAKRSCVIVIAKQLPRGWYSGVLRHERAHCNGWPGSHPH